MSKILDALIKKYDGVENVAVIHAAFDETPHTVALVEVSKALSTDEKLDKAFMLTNSIDDAWYNNKEITKMFDGDGCRSTSVGDMALVGTEKYKCESLGWSKM
jgi:hypothetical protein